MKRADYEKEWQRIVETYGIPVRGHRSHDKLEIVVEPMDFGEGPKKWVKIRMKKGNAFAPSFEDLFRIVVAIVHCENEKYPDLDWAPSDMVGAMLTAAVSAADRLQPRAKKAKLQVIK